MDILLNRVHTVNYLKRMVSMHIYLIYRQVSTYEEGIDFLYSSFFTTCERFLDLPRKLELMALINRMRKIKMVKGGDVI